jgi:hypothetical protein
MTRKMLIWTAVTLGAITGIIGGIISIPAPPPEIDCGNVLCAQCPDGTAPAPTPDSCCACASILK